MTERTGPSQRPIVPLDDLQVEVEPESDVQASVEVPLEDAAEQARPADGGSPPSAPARDVPFDVDLADLAEQAREIENDEDEYR